MDVSTVDRSTRPSQPQSNSSLSSLYRTDGNDQELCDAEFALWKCSSYATLLSTLVFLVCDATLHVRLVFRCIMPFLMLRS